MSLYEYKVVAAPRRAKNIKGVRSHEDQFAAVLAETMNELAAQDWEYLRAESLPCEEKTGLTSRVESYQSVLVFRRRMAAKQKFFDTPPTHQIELHEVKEDRTEVEVRFASGRRAASAVPSGTESGEADDTAGKSGVLDILKNRKARQALDDADFYPEHMKLAGE